MHKGATCFLNIILFSCSSWHCPGKLRMKELGTVATLLVAIGLRVGIYKLQKISHNILLKIVGDSTCKAMVHIWKVHFHLIFTI